MIFWLGYMCGIVSTIAVLVAVAITVDKDKK
jgi:hypothetical protein